MCLQCYLIYTRPDIGEQRGLFWDIPHRWIQFLQLVRLPPYVPHFRFYRWAVCLWTQGATGWSRERIEPARRGNSCHNISRQARDNGVQGLHRKRNISPIKSALFLMSKQSPGAGTSSNEAPERPAFTHINVNEPHGLNLRRQEEFCLASTTSRLRYANLPPYLSNTLKKHTNNFFLGGGLWRRLRGPSLALCKYFNDEAQTHGDTWSQQAVSATCRQTSAFYETSRHYLQLRREPADALCLQSLKDCFLFISLAVSILPVSVSGLRAAAAAADPTSVSHFTIFTSL